MAFYLERSWNTSSYNRGTREDSQAVTLLVHGCHLCLDDLGKAKFVFKSSSCSFQLLFSCWKFDKFRCSMNESVLP